MAGDESPTLRWIAAAPFLPPLHGPALTAERLLTTKDDPEPGAPSQQTRFEVETLPAGTRFESWLRLTRATDLQVAYMADVLATFAASGRLGGRHAIGHGLVKIDAQRRLVAGTAPNPIDWRAEILQVREEALAVLAEIE